MIDLVSECLLAAEPSQPAAPRRFKLQQLAGQGSTIVADRLGEPVLKPVAVNPALYSSEYLGSGRNREWRLLGEVNLLLLQDRPDQARERVQSTLNSSNDAVRAQGLAAMARILKAEGGVVGPANAYLFSLRQPPN